MDNIWDRNHSKSEIIGRCGGDEKNPNDHAEPNRRTLKKDKQSEYNRVSLR